MTHGDTCSESQSIGPAKGSRRLFSAHELLGRRTRLLIYFVAIYPHNTFIIPAAINDNFLLRGVLQIDLGSATGLHSKLSSASLLLRALRCLVWLAGRWPGDHRHSF